MARMALLVGPPLSGGALAAWPRRREVLGLLVPEEWWSRWTGRPGGACDEGDHQPGQDECEVHRIGCSPERVGSMRPATDGYRKF